MKLIGICSAVISVVLGGCMTVGPDYKTPDGPLVNAPLANTSIVGATGAHVQPTPVPANWWRLYDDPVVNQLVIDALKSNTDLRVAEANLARSRAAFDVSTAQGGFSGSVSAAVSRVQDSAEQYLEESKLPVANAGDVGISVSYELDLFGKLKRGVEAARADSDAVQAANDLARITVVADVVRTYVDSCSAAQDLAVARQSLSLQRQRAALSRRLRDLGRGSQPDVTRDQTQAETLAADIPALIGRRSAAQYRLAMLLARAPSDLPAAVLMCQRPPVLSEPIPVGDGQALLKRRPDVREAERQLAASTARIGVATAALYPSVSIGASTGFTGVLDDLGTQPTARWAFGPLISWNFPVNGQRARVREAQASTAGALARFDGVVLNALREVETSLATYAADQARLDSLQAAYRSATQATDETHRLYLAGRESFLADLDATRTLTGLSARVSAAEGQIATDQINLFLALGGGWSQDGGEQSEQQKGSRTVR
ncbi:efflux transporter outer membrane subunit [Paraburkholderia sp.]|uniref:efflux transporter outer membrane subunit n=1 Tax=Paraburkholderia sp. TaxID=1926495 RepID=UPI0023A4B5A2|nr:efflux transporter outer membrane subunit [Paraburkholderia sp.]MDE1180024.1 efflux transporter outer membrane subunit [Paraburkholderia sp.]